ncbi:hypothetical protein TNCV_2477881 [Trichonephila clavipes]|nr:hypothetical protein TNCV_2477881 [Trichonephila clavipes]
MPKPRENGSVRLHDVTNALNFSVNNYIPRPTGLQPSGLSRGLLASVSRVLALVTLCTGAVQVGFIEAQNPRIGTVWKFREICANSGVVYADYAGVLSHVSLRYRRSITAGVGITFQDGDQFNSCQVNSQFGLAIHQNDHQARRRFVEWAQNEIAVVPDFHKRILFSDEAHFWLNGYVNKQNCRIWSEANPQVYVETLLHPEKPTVWCALWAGGIIGPYFFKNDEGHNELWFQQDGATCHTARATIDLLKDTFGDRLISRFGPVNWPPRSCDLTPLDYFLWGYVKSLVYADKPQTLDHLEDNIRRVIADIRPQMLEKSNRKLTSRLDYIRVSRGSPMPEIIFKM